MAKKIAVVAANGKAGRLIVKEAVERGNDVTDAYIEYALPLIQGEIQIKKENSLPRFVHLKKVVAK